MAVTASRPKADSKVMELKRSVVGASAFEPVNLGLEIPPNTVHDYNAYIRAWKRNGSKESITATCKGRIGHGRALIRTKF